MPSTVGLPSAFDTVAHQFYEVPVLAKIRRPSQLLLVRWHLAIGSAFVVVALILAPWLNRHGRNCVAIMGIGYALRAVIWICGGNLPLVPGDSCHYLEVATSVLRGEGPVKHYVESFFRDYARIHEGRGVLDDWATPLDAYVRALAFRLAGLGPSSSLDARLAVAKSCSFLMNLLPGSAEAALRLRPAAIRLPGRDLVHGRARDSAGPCNLRGIRAPGKPRRTHVDPGRLDLDRGLEPPHQAGDRPGPGRWRRDCVAAWPCCRARPG